MGPGADQQSACEFSDKVPPRFDGHTDYASYREDVSLWVNLTTLPPAKHGPAIIGRLQGEAKTAAKTLSTEEICREGGASLILERLDKAYAIDKTNQLDHDLADFLDYTWNKEVSVEHFISGFHTRVDKISDLNLDDKLKGHLLLRQADLVQQERHVVIGAASGSYDVNRISASLRNIYRNGAPTESTQFIPEDDRPNPHGHRRRRGTRRGTVGGSSSGTPGTRPTFYSFRTSSKNVSPRVIVDSGACSSVVGKNTLDKAMQTLNLEKVEDTDVKQKTHRFGNYSDNQPTIFAIKMPFHAKNVNGEKTVEFDVAFDVIEGDLPFLLGLPTLAAMRANVHFKYMTLSFSLHGKYHRLKLLRDGDHVYLPFAFDSVTLQRANGGTRGDSEQQHYTGPSNGGSHYTHGLTDGGRSYYTVRPCLSEPDDAASSHHRLQSLCDEQKYYKCPSREPKTYVAPWGRKHYEGDGAYHSGDANATNDRDVAMNCIETVTNGFPQVEDIPECNATVTKSDISPPPQNRTVPPPKPYLNKREVIKLHLQLRHGTATSMENYIRAAGLWHGSMQNTIAEIIQQCGCQLAFAPKPHVKVGVRPPSTEPQACISIDVIHLEGKNYIHSIDECTTWSEAGCIPNKSMESQIRVLKRMQHLRHGAPRTIRCDNEYNNTEFKEFCKQYGTELIPTAANDHEANGLIENANRTLRSFYDRLRCCDKKSTGEAIIAEALYGKNISLGSKSASAFELLYGRRPRLLSPIDDRLPPPVSIQEHAENAARRRLKKMLRTPVYKMEDIAVGDIVAIWRDASGWLAPARVTKATPYYYEVIHNNRVKTSGINRTRKVSTDTKEEVRPNDTIPMTGSDSDYDSPADETTPPTDDAEEEAGDVADQNEETVDACVSTRSSSHRIPRSELHRILDEAQPLLRDSLASTRSQSKAISNEDGTPHDDAHHMEGPADLADQSVCTPLTDDERMEAFDRELAEWDRLDAYDEVEKKAINHEKENVIGSHVVYKRKLDGSAKARIVPWGHRDKDKDYLRGDAPSVSFDIFRLVLSLCVAFRWVIGQMDVKAAFLQARGFNRRIFVRPPREAAAHGILWLLTAAAYGLTDSGRLWYLTSNHDLIHKHGLTRSRYDHTLYYSTNTDGILDFVLVVQVDDYLYGGTPERMESFEGFLKDTFTVSKLARSNLSLMGCDITQHSDYSITLSQSKKMADLDPQILLEALGKGGDSIATLSQATAYRHVIGKMLFIGRMSAPVMLLHASMAASKLADLRRHHLRALTTTLNRLKTEPAELHFHAPNHNIEKQFVIDIISDGATAVADETRGRSGHIIFRRQGQIVHPIQWSARKLRRVARSSATAEILSAAEAMSNGLYLREVMAEICTIPHVELTVDSTSLQSLSTSIKEPEERLNKVDLAAIREAFDNGELNAVHWCPGPKLLSDALTKDNRATASLLHETLRSGKHERPAEMKTKFGHSS